MDKIRVGIIGCGNCFSGLFQSLELYRTKFRGKEPIGLMHEKIGDYSIFDIDFVAAWDVGANKIGKPLTVAIFAKPNLVDWIDEDEDGRSPWWREHMLVDVREAPILDGVGIYVENKINPRHRPEAFEDLEEQITKEIVDKKVEVLVNYLPVGSEEATKFWATMALKTKCAFVNNIPSFIASDPEWEKRFRDAGIPIIGDDTKGQIGATITHRALVKLTGERGVKLDRTYQLNVGGNTDFLNMREVERLRSKKISKTSAVQSQLVEELGVDDIHIGPSDHIPFLGNEKRAYIWLEGRSFGERRFDMELKLRVDDKSMSAGIVVDAIRCAKIALNRGMSGSIEAPSAYYCKHPLKQFSDDEAKKMVDEFIDNGE